MQLGNLKQEVSLTKSFLHDNKKTIFFLWQGIQTYANKHPGPS